SRLGGFITELYWLARFFDNPENGKPERCFFGVVQFQKPVLADDWRVAVLTRAFMIVTEASETNWMVKVEGELNRAATPLDLLNDETKNTLANLFKSSHKGEKIDPAI